MTDNQIVSYKQENSFIAPVVDVQTALCAYQGMKDFVSQALRNGADYDTIPGTSKDTLLKPGAEKLARFFGLQLSFECLESVTDWTGKDHGSEPFFFYRYKSIARRNGQQVAEGIGSCSSWEKKYRYRRGERVCPKCNQTAIIKGKEEYGGGWLCWKKNGGCNAKFKDGDKAIESQDIGDIANPNPADLVNTIDKMAQKRALVGNVLIACNASEYFTQDMDDFTDAEWMPAAAKPAPTSATVTFTKPANSDEVLEVIDYEPEPTVHTNAKRSWDGAVITAITKAGLSKDGRTAVLALNKSSLADTKDVDAAVEWMTTYRTYRNTGMDPDLAASMTNGDETAEGQAELGI